MKRMFATSLVLVAALTSNAFAADAETSARAGSHNGRNNGTAGATARYEGEFGFASTSTQSGPINRSRGVAVGVDENGVAISVSGAVAPKNGPAVATNFNISVDRDGDVETSRSMSVARGPIHREAHAGGATKSGRNGSATSIAGGKTDRFGRVEAESRSESFKGGSPTLVRTAGGKVVRLSRDRG